MADNTLSILTPSVNNLTARIFVRAAGLDFEEVDVGGNTTTPEFLAKDLAHLTPMLEEDGLPRRSLWESCAIMQYLCNKHGLDRYELYIYKQWLRVYMRSKMIKHNKDLFESLDDPLALLDKLHIY